MAFTKWPYHSIDKPYKLSITQIMGYFNSSMQYMKTMLFALFELSCCSNLVYRERLTISCYEKTAVLPSSGS